MEPAKGQVRKDKLKLMNDVEFIVIDLISLDERTLKLKSPIQITPTFKGKLYYAKLPTLSLFCTGSRLCILKEEIEEHLVFLWDTYAKECDHKLTAKAQELKLRLLELIVEVPNY